MIEPSFTLAQPTCSAWAGLEIGQLKISSLSASLLEIFNNDRSIDWLDGQLSMLVFLLGSRWRRYKKKKKEKKKTIKNNKKIEFDRRNGGRIQGQLWRRLWLRMR